MQSYKIWLDSPALNVHAALQNLGGPIEKKAGVFTVCLVDEQGDPLKHSEYDLPVSKHLGKCYVYVAETPEGGLIHIGKISATRAFQGVEIQYQPVFTENPLATSQLGHLFCNAEWVAPNGESRRTITKLTRPQSTNAGERE